MQQESRGASDGIKETAAWANTIAPSFQADKLMEIEIASIIIGIRNGHTGISAFTCYALTTISGKRISMLQYI
jgi:hypothetical protein